MKEGIRNQLLVSEYVYGIEWNRNADMRVLDAIAEYAPEVGLFEEAMREIQGILGQARRCFEQ